MRYLAYIEPPDKVRKSLERLSDEYSFTTPGSGHHITLWGFSIKETRERELVRRLNSIEHIPSPYEFYSINPYGKGSLGLTADDLEGGLRHMHEEVVKNTACLDKDKALFNEMYERIGGENYTPHLTFAREYEGIICVEAFESVMFKEYKSRHVKLAKKKNGVWQPVPL